MVPAVGYDCGDGGELAHLVAQARDLRGYLALDTRRLTVRIYISPAQAGFSCTSSYLHLRNPGLTFNFQTWVGGMAHHVPKVDARNHAERSISVNLP